VSHGQLAMQLQFFMYSPFILHATLAIRPPAFECPAHDGRHRERCQANQNHQYDPPGFPGAGEIEKSVGFQKSHHILTGFIQNRMAERQIANISRYNRGVAKGWLLITVLLAWAVFAAGQQPAELPEGDGRKILETACAACHDWKDVTKFRGYKKEEWADLVHTMVQYGAMLDETQANVLVEYLVKNLGPESK
jgi:hypothetical protein